jgi:cytochrome c biogenesis protein CcmG, thiol:disulfide interchange protein DsbE
LIAFPAIARLCDNSGLAWSDDSFNLTNAMALPKIDLVEYRLGHQMIDADVGMELSPRRPARRVWLVGAAGLIVAGLLALLYYGLTTQRLQTGVMPRPNTEAPDFSLQTFDGKTVHLADLRGKVVVLNFWASWCVPCKDEQPALEAMAKQYASTNVAFVGVNIQDTRADALGFLDLYHVTYPIVTDPDGKVYINYGVVGVPETYLVDTSGRIQQKLVGPVDEGELSTLLEGMRR